MTRTILSILGLALAAGVLIYFTQPTYAQVQKLKVQSGQYDQAIDKSDKLQKLKETLELRRKSFSQSDLDRLHKMLPDHVDNVRLILDLDRLAGSFGMALQNVVVSTPSSESANKNAIGTIGPSDQRYDSLTLRFTTRGAYAKFVQFLESLESSLRIVDMVSLTLSQDTAASKTTGSSENSYRYDITIRTYWLR